MITLTEELSVGNNSLYNKVRPYLLTPGKMAFKANDMALRGGEYAFNKIKPLVNNAGEYAYNKLGELANKTGDLARQGGKYAYSNIKKVLPIDYVKNVTTGFGNGLATAGKAAVLGTGLAAGAGYINSLNGS